MLCCAVICDIMTAGLAKHLRLYGVDAAAVQTKGKGSCNLVFRSVIYSPFTWQVSLLIVHLHGCMAYMYGTDKVCNDMHKSADVN